MDRPMVGIDLGGTKIGAGVVDADGAVLSSDYQPTAASQGPGAVIERIVSGVDRALEAAGMTCGDVAGIGIGAPGPLDIPRGVLTEPPNLPGWHDVPLRQIIAERVGLPTYLENDANAAAIGEYLYGAGRGTQNMIYVTVSTGIGGGLILNGRIYHGASGGAGEIGHMTVLPRGPHCGCGNRGCLEALASGTAIAREGQEQVARGVPTRIAELAQGPVTAKDVVDAMHEGDPYAADIVREAMDYLGVGMANLVNLFNPDRIVFGGGLTALGPDLIAPVQRAIQLRAFRSAASQVTVCLAELGASVGIVGAAGAAVMAARQA
ncbi:MAG: ROK family protein [Anaerolineae bacterium]|nr:ROK family protein [Anaerolineae bacterium]